MEEADEGKEFGSTPITDEPKPDKDEEAKEPLGEAKTGFNNIPDPIHDDPNLYVVRKRPKRALPGTKPEKAKEVQ